MLGAWGWIDAPKSSVSSACERCGCARGPAVDNRKEAALRFAGVTRAIKEFLRFTEGYGPGRYDKSGCKMSIRIAGRLVASSGQHQSQCAGKIVSHLPRARLERLAGHGRLDEPARVSRQHHEFMVLRNEVMRQFAGCFDRRDIGATFANAFEGQRLDFFL